MGDGLQIVSTSKNGVKTSGDKLQHLNRYVRTGSSDQGEQVVNMGSAKRLYKLYPSVSVTLVIFVRKRTWRRLVVSKSLLGEVI